MTGRRSRARGSSRPATPSTGGRPGGRRIAMPRPAADAPGVNRATLLAGVLVLMTVAALWFAGATPRSTGTPTLTTHTTSVSRDFSCIGGIAGATAQVGEAGSTTPGVTIDGKAATSAPTRLTATPARVLAAASLAPAAYAVRSASGNGWLAAGQCPAPRADWWFPGAGASSVHSGILELDNPRAGDAIVDIDVLGPKGVVQAPGLHGLRVAAGKTVRLDLSKVAPAVGDLAVHVNATRGLVAASIIERWSANFVTRKASDWVTDQPTAARQATLVGIAPAPAHATLLVANPTAREAVVSLSFVGTKGTYAPTSNASVTVPPDTVFPVDLDGQLKTAPLAVRLHSQVPVVATLRSTRGTDEVYASDLEPIGATAVAGVPPGVPAAVVLVAGPGRPRPLTVIGYDAAGHQVGSRTVTVPTNAAVRLPVWARARVVSVSGPGAGDVVGSVVLGSPSASGRTVAQIPLTNTANDAHVPTVRPGW